MAVMEANGCRLTSQIVGEIVSRYSLTQQEGATILQVLAWQSPLSHHRYRSQVRDQIQAKNGAQSRQDGNRRRPSRYASRPDLSLALASPPNSSTGGNQGREREYDAERIVIDYQKLCHEIYPNDWQRK
jgi:hypothetical protein